LPELMADRQLHKYQPVTGYPPLVDAIRSKLASENGLHTQGVSQVMVTAGSNMAFLNSVLAVSDPGDEFILPTPFYFNQEMAIRMCGCEPVLVRTRADWSLDVEALAAAITPRTRAIVTVSPNNPTGAVYSEADLRAVNALCARAGIYHFSDEAYEYFTFDGARHFSPGSLPGAHAHTLSFYSFSKNYGMASWRVGYVVFPSELAEAMEKVQDTNLICAPMPSQLLALEALRLGKAQVHANLEELARVRSTVYASLGHAGDLVRFPRTQGAFYILMRLPGVDDAPAFNRAMIEKHKVATIPGFAFGLTDVRRDNYQRLSFGALDAATAAEGTERFLAAVKDWYSA
ncbi:MAG: aminotransferase class I/II-fold pyridoxal phosphate-dependent enzyme, partial [Ramlibacter sp.]